MRNSATLDGLRLEDQQVLQEGDRDHHHHPPGAASAAMPPSTT